MKARITITALFVLLLRVGAYSQIGFPYCETFTEAETRSATVLGASASLGSGVLRLTSNQASQRGYMYIDIPFSSAFGIKASFEFFSYGGDGADGLTFFLYDAAVPVFSIGGFGGSLGYANRTDEAGLAGAFLGVGFDEFGNFGNTSEQKNGGFEGVGDSEVSNSIVIRGPGNGYTGYQFIKGRRTMEGGVDGLPSDQRFPISSGGIGTGRVTDPNQPGYRQVEIILERNPNGVGYLISLVMQFTVEPNIPRILTIFDREPYPYEAPENLKVGFAASTGAYTNFHEIRNLVVEVANGEHLEIPSGADLAGIPVCEGQENTYQLAGEDIDLPNKNSVITCVQFYSSYEDIEEVSDDSCVHGGCREENQVLELPQGTIRAAGGGNYIFNANEGFVGDSITVYYTLTDNYGKTSQGNSLTFDIQESTSPVRLIILGKQDEVSDTRLCAGERVVLQAMGGVAFDRYEWYKNGGLIPGEEGDELTVSVEGEYYVRVYSGQNCPSTSTVVKVVYPSPPTLEMTGPVIGCSPEESVDISAYIAGYDPQSFDYLLKGMGSSYFNEEIRTIYQEGEYSLQIKEKGLDCYSQSILISVIIPEKELVADFDFEIQSSGIKGDVEGAVFPDDVLQFRDLSSERAVAWLWEFGDGTTSNAQNPTHVFGKKGLFELTLTVTDELGCEEMHSKVLLIPKSYRLMFPTGFTPTSADNRFFVPKFKGLARIELMIFNMWGELIFRTDRLDTEGWDGKLKGEFLDAGVFVFHFNSTAVDGERITETGKFKLIR